MKDAILRITQLQINLSAEITREVEHGATLKETHEAIAETITDVLHTPVSAGWVSGFARNNPRTLAHASIARVMAVEKLLADHVLIWGSAARGTY